MSDEPDPRIAELNGWMQEDEDIRLMGQAVFRAWGVMSVQGLKREQPEIFDELHESAKDLLDQYPTVKGPVWEN